MPDDPAADVTQSFDPTPHSPSVVPAQIGSYRILDVLGTGGMGVVYRAEQASPKRVVALKVIGRSFVTREMLRRFELEAQTLGRLKHPGIAQVYEAGVNQTQQGPQPFFAMELIDGVQLDEFVKRNNLTTRQRLELLIKICDAVQHAHQQGIIHRDLKPDNILVTSDGQPKILDFGVARATDSDVQATTMHTDVGKVIGTLPYMSPEQAGGNSEDVDTRSDVYALGVIAYELLAGRLPYDLSKRALAEAVRIIREEEPTRLSSISRTLRGDVETIVGKALAKEKERRYASASGFAADIQRYLSDEPISARPPGAWYQFNKFARRHTGLVAGLAATFMVLIAGIIVSTSLYVRVERQRTESKRQQQQAQEERDNANATLDFLSNDVLSGATPEKIPDVKVRDQIVSAMIMPAANRVGEAFKDRPLMEASIRDAIQTVLGKIGRSDLALPHAQTALALRRRLLGADHQKTIASLNNCAYVLDALGKAKEAEPMFREALERHRQLLGNDDPTTLQSLNNYAGVLLSLGRAADAAPLYKDTLERRRRVLGVENRDTIASLNDYASVINSLGRFKEAEPLHKLALEQSRRILGEDHPHTIASLDSYAGVLGALGLVSQAEPLYKEAWDRRRRVLGDNHPDTIMSMNNYAFELLSLGRPQDAEPLFKEALERYRHVRGEEHRDTLLSLGNYASVLKATGRADEAEPLFKRALEGYRNALGEDHPETLRALNNYAGVLRSLRRPAEAEPFYKDALERYVRVLGANHPDTINILNNYASALEAMGRMEEAEGLYKQAVERYRHTLGSNHPSTLQALNNYAGLLYAMGRAGDAEPLCKEAFEGRNRVLGANHADTMSSLNNYAAVLEKLGRWTAAELLYRDLVAKATNSAEFGAKHPRTKKYAGSYAKCLDVLGRHAEAVALRKQFGLPDPSTQPATTTRPTSAPASQPSTQSAR